MAIAPGRSLLLAVVATAGCAGSAARPDHRAPSPGDRSEASATCPAGASGSGYPLWPPGDRCAELDARWHALPASARACGDDRDCALVTGPCFITALRADAVAGGYHESPCVHPAGGLCPPPEEQRAACVDGCCVAAP